MREPLAPNNNRHILHAPSARRAGVLLHPQKSTNQKPMPFYLSSQPSQYLHDKKIFGKNSKSILNTLIIREKQRQKNNAAKLKEKDKLASLVERIDDRADQVDTTLTAFSYGIMAITTMWTNFAPFLMNTLNSIPWISCVLNILNGLFRLTHSLILKSLKNESHKVTTRTKIKRGLLAFLGLASMALGLASMFSIAASVALTIACAAVDFAYSLVPLVIALYRCAKPDGDNTRSFEVKRMFTKLEYSVLTALILVGSTLLFMPPFMPIGFALLIGTAIYGILDRFDKNPFKLLYEFARDQLRGEKNKITEEEKTNHELKNVASDKKQHSTSIIQKTLDNQPTSIEKTMPTTLNDESLFEKFYCQSKPKAKPINEKTVYYDRKHYVNFLKHPDRFKKNEDYAPASLRVNA